MKRKLNQVVLEKDQVVVLEEAAAVKAAVQEGHPAAPAGLEAVQIVVAGAAVQAAVQEDQPAAPAGLEAVQIVVAEAAVQAAIQAAVRAIQAEVPPVAVVNPIDQAVAPAVVVLLTGIGQVEALALCQVDQLE